MKEKPILFSAPMVRAILEGRKTMTRRVIKPQPVGKIVSAKGHPCVSFEIGREFVVDDFRVIRCPYGKVGDRLWVRESFWQCTDNNDKCRYVADGEPPSDERRHYKKRPSIFLRRVNSRILLEITGVRVERLQDITGDDAKNEGAPALSFMELKQMPPSLIDSTGALYSNSYRYGFYDVWSKINGPGSWDANPWVWVVEFRRIEK